MSAPTKPSPVAHPWSKAKLAFEARRLRYDAKRIRSSDQPGDTHPDLRRLHQAFEVTAYDESWMNQRELTAAWLELAADFMEQGAAYRRIDNEPPDP